MRSVERDDRESLVVVGNGFDLMHEMKTGLVDFQRWWLAGVNDPQSELVKHLVGCRVCMESAPPCEVGDGLMETSADDVSESPMLECLYDTLNADESIREAFFLQICALAYAVDSNPRELFWTKFEELLGGLALPGGEPPDDSGDWRPAYAVEDRAVLNLAAFRLPASMRRWASGVEASSFRFPRVAALLHRASLIVTFNYTSTLEQTYGVAPQMICHLHGWVGEPRDTLRVGHGLPVRDPDTPTEGGRGPVYDMVNDDYRNSLRKVFEEEKLEAALAGRCFGRVATIGLSYGKTDREYIKQVCAHTDRDTDWFAYGHSEADGRSAMLSLQGAGLRGKLHIRRSVDLRD